MGYDTESEKEDYLKFEGNASSMIFAMRVSDPNLQESQFCCGSLIAVGDKQLVAQYAPKIWPNSFVQLRQDGKDDDAIDISAVKPEPKGGFPLDKDHPWHKQEKNKVAFYYKNFVIESGISLQVGIGSGITEQQLLQEFYRELGSKLTFY